MINPSRYRTIAVASTFSPRFKQVIAEAKRIRDRFSSEFHLIYVGERNEETAKKFRDALAQLQLPFDSPIHYEKGDPAEAIFRVLAEQKIDMVVAGALEKEVVLHPFLGNVARRLVREASGSVMLFTKPEVKPKPLRRIVFVADYSTHGLRALKTALALPGPSMDIAARCPYRCRHCNGAPVSTIWLAASHGHFSYNRLALCACWHRALHKIVARRTCHYRCSLNRTNLQLYRLPNFRSQLRHGDVAANAAFATV